MKKLIIFITVLTISLVIIFNGNQRAEEIQPAVSDEKSLVTENESEIAEKSPEKEDITIEPEEKTEVQVKNEGNIDTPDDKVQKSEPETETTEQKTESPGNDEKVPENDIDNADREESEEDTLFVPEDAESEISLKDKLTAMKYAVKLDVKYLKSLVGNGIDENDKELIQNHLKEKLTDKEYEEVKGLIVKYIYLLE